VLRPPESVGAQRAAPSGVCTLVGSSGRASFAQRFTLGWGMYGPQGADASGYALGGFDIARSVAVEFWAVCFLGPGLSRSTRRRP